MHVRAVMCVVGKASPVTVYRSVERLRLKMMMLIGFVQLYVEMFSFRHMDLVPVIFFFC